MKYAQISSAIVAATVMTAGAQAEIMDFVLDWSGASFSNSATATGMISIDMGELSNPGLNDTFDNPFVTAFSITVTGSTMGDGTWSLEDYDSIILDTDYGPEGGDLGGGGNPVTALDFSQELIGQPTSRDPWGTSQPGGTGGDFNIFTRDKTVGPGGSAAPYGTYYFEITVGGAFADILGGPGPSGERLLLTSFRPIPTPGGAALCGLAGLALGARRRR